MSKTTKIIIAIFIRALVAFTIVWMLGYPDLPTWKFWAIVIPLSFAIPKWIEFDYEATH